MRRLLMIGSGTVLVVSLAIAAAPARAAHLEDRCRVLDGGSYLDDDGDVVTSRVRHCWQVRVGDFDGYDFYGRPVYR